MGSHLNECTTTGQSWERCLQQTEWRQKWIPFSTRNGDELDEWVHWMEDGGVGGSDTDRRMAPYKPFKCLFVHLLCVYVTCVCLVWSVGRSHLYIYVAHVCIVWGNANISTLAFLITQMENSSHFLLLLLLRSDDDWGAHTRWTFSKSFQSLVWPSHLVPPYRGAINVDYCYGWGIKAKDSLIILLLLSLPSVLYH